MSWIWTYAIGVYCGVIVGLALAAIFEPSDG